MPHSVFPEGLALLAAKLFGAVAGSAISIAYVLPRGRREAALRFFTGLVAGLVFGGPSGLILADRLGLSDRLGSVEIALLGAASASLCAWWGLGMLARLAARHGHGPAKPGR